MTTVSWQLWSGYDSATWAGFAQILCQMACVCEQLVAEFAKVCTDHAVKSLSCMQELCVRPFVLTKQDGEDPD